MAHFARIENGTVVAVHVVNNDVLDPVDEESSGVAFLRSLHGSDTEWAQTSYNSNPVGGVDRGSYAGIGYLWDGKTFAPPPVPAPEPLTENAL